MKPTKPGGIAGSSISEKTQTIRDLFPKNPPGSFLRRLIMPKCKGCGKEILFLRDTENGKMIPIDTVPPIYQVNEKTGTCERLRSVGVSHFATCPEANRFSRKSRISD